MHYFVPYFPWLTGLMIFLLCFLPFSRGVAITPGFFFLPWRRKIIISFSWRVDPHLFFSILNRYS